MKKTYGLPHFGAMEREPLENMYHKSFTERLAMSTAIESTEANIIIKEHKSSGNWSQLSPIMHEQ